MSVISGWPPATAGDVRKALAAAAQELSVFQARVEHYHVPEGGYSALTGQAGSEVFSLEARIGKAHRRPGYSMWAVLQVFDPHQPNLALVRFLERRDHDGVPDEDLRRPLYSVVLDGRLCRTFIPVCNRALNGLDPAGRGRSQHVDSYPGRVTAGNLFQVPLLTVGLFRRFRREGQAAIMLVDFTEPLAVPVVQAAMSMMGRRDTHIIPRTTSPSVVNVPLRNHDGTIRQLGGMSTAIDHGIAIARQLLE